MQLGPAIPAGDHVPGQQWCNSGPNYSTAAARISHSWSQLIFKHPTSHQTCLCMFCKISRVVQTIHCLQQYFFFISFIHPLLPKLFNLQRSFWTHCIISCNQIKYLPIMSHKYSVIKTNLTTKNSFTPLTHQPPTLVWECLQTGVWSCLETDSSLHWHCLCMTRVLGHRVAMRAVQHNSNIYTGCPVSPEPPEKSETSVIPSLNSSSVSNLRLCS